MRAHLNIMLRTCVLPIPAQCADRVVHWNLVQATVPGRPPVQALPARPSATEAASCWRLSRLAAARAFAPRIALGRLCAVHDISKHLRGDGPSAGCHWSRGVFGPQGEVLWGPPAPSE